jgi:hypothetical protein
MKNLVALSRFGSVTVVALSFMMVGCDGKKSDAAAAGSAAPNTLAAKSATAKTEPASTLPAKGPWEAVKITYLKDDPKDGSPTFVAENLGGKTVVVCFMDFYGYDDKGNQVAHEELSWNGELKGGKKDESVTTKKTAGVKTWEATYHGIKFEGDASSTMEYKRAPAKRPKGG